MYKIYFYSKPNFLFIDSESILDMDLRFEEDVKIYEIQFKDEFFYTNFKNSKSKEWEITIQSFDEENKFTLQSNISGELTKRKKEKKFQILKFTYDQITNNKVWPSLPPAFEQAESDYKRAKLASTRNDKLNNILSEK
jgi:hypothetical protein